MSDKPIDPKQNESSSKPNDSQTDDSVEKKPPTQKRQLPGLSTGPLKLPLNWNALPDRIKQRNSEQPDQDPDQPKPVADADSSDKSFFSFNKKAEDEPEKNPDTAVLPNQSPSWQKIIDGQAQGTTSTLGEQREVLFVIRGMIERVVMQDNGIVTMGRFDTGTVPNEEIDLIPYGALDRGVSRRHCEIQLRDNNLFVTDLQSTNGTFLAGVRLKPHEAMLLRKGDELLLGRLAVQILFR